MHTHWKAFREPLSRTLARTVTIAVLGGAGLAWGLGGLRLWPAAILVLLWVSLGGHVVEVCFLNSLRPRLPAYRVVQACARIGWWVAGGMVLGLGAKMTATVTALPVSRWPAWWVAGPAFVGVELIAHLGMVVRRLPNFFDGRG